jgi:hypothetical protein
MNGLMNELADVITDATKLIKNLTELITKLNLSVNLAGQ